MISEIIKYCFFLGLSQFLSLSCFAQNQTMIHEGTIEYEKRVNTYAILNQYYSGDAGSGDQFAKDYKERYPQFKTTRFSLNFDDSLSFYQPSLDTVGSSNPFLSSFAGSNSVLSYLAGGAVVSVKDIFGEKYTVKDARRKISWKLTDEIREIGGFTCRRANALIFDSYMLLPITRTRLFLSQGQNRSQDYQV